MAAGVTLLLKRKSGAFAGGDLDAGEVGLDLTNGHLYYSVDGTTVSRVGAKSYEVPVGGIIPFAGIEAPDDFLFCDGDEVSTDTYNDLVGVIGGVYGFGVSGVNFISATSGSPTLTATSSAPALGTWVLLSGAGTVFNYTIPAGMNDRSKVPLYVVSRPTSTTFTVSLTAGGSAINASATGSAGVVANVINLPDLRGRIPYGRDDMGGTDANMLTTLTNDGDILGVTGGAETHTLDTTEIPAHTHTVNNASHLGFVGSGGAATVSGGSTYANSSTSLNSAGGGGAHNNLPPLLITNFIIRAK